MVKDSDNRWLNNDRVFKSAQRRLQYSYKLLADLVFDCTFRRTSALDLDIALIGSAMIVETNAPRSLDNRNPSTMTELPTKQQVASTSSQNPQAPLVAVKQERCRSM
mmetsp:Transcript_1263/g.2303  ORF Transcript_1263/g.2303 Transcript_1263/m.2303 type:complete len:107 (+) Transcript_1263:1364-1684(+)